MGQGVSALRSISDINLFCYRDSIVHLYAEVSDGALNLGMAQKQLNCSQIASPAIDQSRLRAPQGMRSE
jgi:hypothetical protein